MVNQPKWTPGPLNVAEIKRGTEYYVGPGPHGLVRAGEVVVARCNRLDDARLFAAAPDLYAGSDQDRIDLEALRSEITGGDCRWPPMALVLVDGILVSIERRLARARGEG